MSNILITGGSKGIGETLVRELAKQGNHVLLNYNKSEQQAKLIQRELNQEGVSIEIFKADVSKREEVKKLNDYFLFKYKDIDVLINNAGISQTKLFTEITDEDWNEMINVNLSSAFYMTREVLPNMIHNKKGCIINISSIWGLVGGACEVHYSATKAGLIGMTKALAKEIGLSNIRVNAIAPGIIDTDMNINLTENEKKQIVEQIPLNKLGKTIDISRCVQWLIKDEYTTGQVISINGGWTM